MRDALKALFNLTGCQEEGLLRAAARENPDSQGGISENETLGFLFYIRGVFVIIPKCVGRIN